MKEEDSYELSWQDFMKVEMRVGTVVEAKIFEEARIPSYIIKVDFGEYGMRKSSAQLTKLYSIGDIIGKQVVAVMNFPKKQIGPFMSECLIMGAMGDNNEVILLEPERNTKNGLRIG